MTNLVIEHLNPIKLLRSADDLKTDLELTCTVCGSHLCDVEPDDELVVLVSVATDHVCL